MLSRIHCWRMLVKELVDNIFEAIVCDHTFLMCPGAVKIVVAYDDWIFSELRHVKCCSHLDGSFFGIVKRLKMRSPYNKVLPDRLCY